MADKYLSTDPAAGQKLADAFQTPEYLSMSADAGRAANVAPGSNLGLGMAAGAAGLASGAPKVAMELATNKNVPKVAAAAGKFIGRAAPVVAGYMSHGATGALAGAMGAKAASTAEIGEQVGRMVGRVAQKVAAPVARGFEAVAPYAQGALQTLAGAQGALDLAQMAEPERRDIGVMGIGPPVPAGAIPTAPELVAMPVEKAVNALTDAGWPEARAKSYVTQMRKLLKAS